MTDMIRLMAVLGVMAGLGFLLTALLLNLSAPVLLVIGVMVGANVAILAVTNILDGENQ